MEGGDGRRSKSATLALLLRHQDGRLRLFGIGARLAIQVFWPSLTRTQTERRRSAMADCLERRRSMRSRRQFAEPMPQITTSSEQMLSVKDTQGRPMCCCLAIRNQAMNRQEGGFNIFCQVRVIKHGFACHYTSYLHKI
jgi:hypothetical protein